MGAWNYAVFDDDTAYDALVSAAVIDSVINEIHYTCDDEDYFDWD